MVEDWSKNWCESTLPDEADEEQINACSAKLEEDLMDSMGIELPAE